MARKRFPFGGILSKMSSYGNINVFFVTNPDKLLNKGSSSRCINLGLKIYSTTMHMVLALLWFGTRWPMDSPHKGRVPGRVIGKTFPCHDVIMGYRNVEIHYSDVIMGVMASQITSLAIVYSTAYSGADLRKHQSSASLAFVCGEFTGDRRIPRTKVQ